MLIPKEKPFLSGLNSYYLKIDKFVEHLQGEIGSGCLYCQSAGQELLVYFDEQEIVRGLMQNKGERARVSSDLKPVLDALNKKNFYVSIYYLDANSIFFWGQMPQFKRAKAKLKSTDITLPDVIFRLRQKKFSGFVDVEIEGDKGSALLFFINGERKGGSFSWGRGGLTASNDDYNRLLGLLQTNTAVYDIGHFIDDIPDEAEFAVEETQGLVDSAEEFSSLETGLQEFFQLFARVTRKKLKIDPLTHIKQQALDLMDEYPVLDPFNNFYELGDDGRIEFTDKAPKEEIAKALVLCAWNAVENIKLQKKFKTVIQKWAYRSALEDRGISVER